MKVNFSLKKRFLYLSSALLLALITISTFVLDRVYHQTQYNSQKLNASALLNLLIASTELSSNKVFEVDTGKLPEDFFNGKVVALIQDSKSDQTVWQSTPATLDNLPKSTLPLGEVFFKKLRPFNERKSFIASLPMQWQVDDSLFYNITFSVVQSGQRFLDQQAYFRFRAIIAILILGIVFIILQYLFINRSFSPINAIGQAIDSIRKGKKDRVDNVSIPNELLGMTQSLNLLLDHQKTLHSSSKQAADDLAHSLKTPLTGLKSQIELLDQTSEKEKAQLKELIHNANGLIERKLSLLKQQHQSVFIKPIEIKPIIKRVAQALQKSNLNQNLAFEIDAPSALNYPIHPDDMYELMGNILENAFKYASNTVFVKALQNKDSLNLTIQDDGKGFPTDNPMQLLARGKRLDEQSDGTGLGLYISEQIVSRYKGNIQLCNRNGAKVEIQLPLKR